MRVRKLGGKFFTRFEGTNDRRAATGLHREHLRPRWAYPAECLHLIESFPHPDKTCAAAGRIKDNIGQDPVELFSQLIAQRFLSFDAERFLESRHFELTLVSFASRNL